VFLTLLPAVRRGPGYVRASGGPWPWPFYPWSVFVFLAVAVAGRAFLLCWSLHLLAGASGSQLIFGPYFLVPFGLALAVLLLELGLVARSRVTQWVALLAPVGLAGLAAVGHRDDAIYAEFLGRFAAALGGTPLFLTLLASAGFYLYAWARGVRFAPDGLTAVLAALAFVRPGTLTAADLTSPRPEPLAAAALLQVALGLWRRDGWRLASGGAAPAGWLGVAGWRGYRGLREEVAGLDYLALSLVFLPVAVLISLGQAGVLRRWVAAWRGRAASRAG
jgi:hypothetical protein